MSAYDVECHVTCLHNLLFCFVSTPCPSTCPCPTHECTHAWWEGCMQGGQGACMVGGVCVWWVGCMHGKAPSRHPCMHPACPPPTIHAHPHTLLPSHCPCMHPALLPSLTYSLPPPMHACCLHTCCPLSGFVQSNTRLSADPNLPPELR